MRMHVVCIIIYGIIYIPSYCTRVWAPNYSLLSYEGRDNGYQVFFAHSTHVASLLHNVSKTTSNSIYSPFIIVCTQCIWE